MGNNRNRNRNKKQRPQEDNYIPPFPANQLAAPIECLGLREETLELLKGAGLASVVDLVKRTDTDFYRIMRFNKKNLLDVKSRLNAQKMFLKPQPEPMPSAETDKKPQANGGERPEPNGNVRRNADGSRNNGGRGEREFGASQHGANGSRPNAQSGRTRDVRQNPRDARGKNDRMRPDDISERKTKELKEKSRPTRTMPEIVQDIYVKVNKGGKWGFSDRKGKIVVTPVYDEIYSYKEDLCCVELNEKAGYIDRNGEVVIEPQYECASSFSEGYACVFKGDKCGYINKANEVVVEFQFDAGTAFENGSCRVKKDGKWGELNFVTREDGSITTAIRWIV